ncbi:D-aminopeptidase [Leminorella grimontii]|uniref:D-aminopeptidase n=1 Tax=Leminorella grimontii TaxID=82981 RepID=A0AAV5MYQ1_9GAMM|nr:P1 family peptidase [Leminorella grimontii]KFC97649.1 putative peptidase [Leminorella grimontii ATCC 33999 = DSM 5078]GKX54988.1 D-aminopeptidase [Leminorella grimontii]VFS57106.1 L-aminopeptidase/D-esterase [Leminorella grimontii]
MATSAHSVLPPYIGQLPAGKLNLITDVQGLEVGHSTVNDGAHQTGVTVITPHSGNLFCDKVPAAATVLNGFGKSVGLVQVDELGVLETPIALTNTFSVGAMAQAQIRQAVAQNPEIGRAWSTVNPLVFECNDGYLNDIQAMILNDSHYETALKEANAQFAQGTVGAGRGMSCFELKGGIGSASRIATLASGQTYTVGALVLANFGRLPTFTLAGKHLGTLLKERLEQQALMEEKGSIIMIVATDAPLDSRQLGRLSLRAGVGLSRTGAFFGNGSGDISLAFSTAYTVPQQTDRPMPSVAFLHDALMDPLFQATADSVEQAIVNALWYATTTDGRDGNRRVSLRDLAPDLQSLLAS